MEVEAGEPSETQDSHKKLRQVEATSSAQLDAVEGFVDVRKGNSFFNAFCHLVTPPAKLTFSVQSVIVKVYENQDENALNRTLLLNDAVEFIGILSMDPQIAQHTFNENSAGAGPSEIENFDRKEMIARNPPSSLVPRLHVLHYEKIASGNPLLPFNSLDLSPPLDVSSVR
jgi:hypothetical protein